jgi:uncharacterized damage-inducible protein DinB
MSDLAELHRFNAWANRRLLAGVRQLPPDQLEEVRDGMYRSILGVLAHLAQVEAAYLTLMTGRPSGRPALPGSLAETEAMLGSTADGLVELAGCADLARTFHIPWFGRDFTLFQGLSQVLTHSMNHRADVNQWLPRFGLESTDQDYIDLALSE